MSGSPNLSADGATAPNSGASEVYVKSSDPIFLAKLAFHELMHNRLKLGDAELHSQGGLASGNISSSTPLTAANIEAMARVIKDPIAQWTEGIDILTSGRFDLISEYYQATANPAEKIVTASVLIIGNEILSGRTQDVNLAYIAKGLNEVGVTLREARVIPDVAKTIVATLNELRAKFDYVFTTGGIGPTHDDITLECVAQAFGVPWTLHPEAHALLKEWYKDRPGQLNAARLRMATAPEGSTLIVNPVSRAPGFRMGNVFVMAGIPRVMQSMFDHVKSTLEGGRPVVSRSVRCNLPEGVIAKGLEDIQNSHPDCDLSSYPWEKDGNFGTSLVVRGRDPECVDAATREVVEMVLSLGGNPQEE